MSAAEPRVPQGTDLDQSAAPLSRGVSRAVYILGLLYVLSRSDAEETADVSRIEPPQ